MQNGEDVIANVFEMRQGEDQPPLAYKLEMPYTMVIQAPAQNLFEEPTHGEPTTLDNVDVEFQAFVPFSASPFIYVPLPSVSFIYTPLENVVSKYQELTAKNAEIDVVEERSKSVPDGDDDGTGRGTVDSD
jgi:hypothetical protein